MGFGDLTSAAGLAALNTYLLDKSYIEGCAYRFLIMLLCADDSTN